MNEASSPLAENSHSSFTHNPDRKAAWTCCKASFYSGCTKNLVRFRLTLMAWHIQMRPIMPLKSKGPSFFTTCNHFSFTLEGVSQHISDHRQTLQSGGRLPILVGFISQPLADKWFSNMSYKSCSFFLI